MKEKVDYDFMDMIVHNHKQHTVKNLTDDEICESNLALLASALDDITMIHFDMESMWRVLSFYLLNSNECIGVKTLVADHVRSFIKAAQILSNCELQLGVLCETLHDMTKD